MFLATTQKWIHRLSVVLFINISFVLFLCSGGSLRSSRSSRMCHAPLVTTCPLKLELGLWAAWCMFISCLEFWLNSQALLSTQDDLCAIHWQCPSVLCPFALWSFSLCLSISLVLPLSSFMLCSPVSFCLIFFLLMLRLLLSPPVLTGSGDCGSLIGK